MLRFANWIVILSTLVGCATAYNVPSFDYSLPNIQKAIASNLPSGLAFVSQNRRDFYSKVFTIPGEKKTPISLVMKVIIIGDRRPYDLSFQIHKVEKIQGSAQEVFDLGERFVGEDSLSKRTALKVESSLTKSQNEKNLFDDFRPF